jgi:hypothetical protein
LSRAQRSEFQPAATEAAVFRLLFGQDASRVSAAALSYYHDFGVPPAGYCLRADPVHLRVDTRGLILFDADSFSGSNAELEALADSLREHLATDGWRLESHRGRWYLLGETSSELHTAALHDVCGKALRTSMLTGSGATDWIRRLNEIQMLLNGHAVNQQRQLQGKPAINSIWLWGGGRWETPPVAQCVALASSNECVLGGAEAQGIAILQPDTAQQFRQDCERTGELLVLREDCRRALAYADISAWTVALCSLEQNWFAPLLKLLATGWIRELRLFPLNGYCYRLSRPALPSFWKSVQDYRRMPDFRVRSGIHWRDPGTL